MNLSITKIIQFGFLITVFLLGSHMWGAPSQGMIQKLMQNARQPNQHINLKVIKPADYKEINITNFCKYEIDDVSATPVAGNDKTRKVCEKDGQSADQVTCPGRTLKLSDASADGKTACQETESEKFCLFEGQRLKIGTNVKSGEQVCTCRTQGMDCSKVPPKSSLSLKLTKDGGGTKKPKPKQRSGCSIESQPSGAGNMANWLYMLMILLPLLAVRFQKYGKTTTLSVLALAMMFSISSCSSEDSSDVKTNITGSQGSLDLHHMNILLHKKDTIDRSDTYEVFFIEAFTSSKASLVDSAENSNTNGNQAIIQAMGGGEPTLYPAPYGLAISKEINELLVKFANGETLSAGEQAKVFNNPNLNIYKAILDGEEIEARIIQDPLKSEDQAFNVYFYTTYKDRTREEQLIIGKYTSTAYQNFENNLLTNHGTPEKEKKVLLQDSFMREEFSFFEQKFYDHIDEEFEEIDFWLDAFDHLEAKGYLNAFNLNEKQLFPSAFAKDEKGVVRAETHWNKLFQDYDLLQTRYQIPSKDQLSDTQKQIQHLYSLYLCQFDPISLESTADLCVIESVEKGRNGTGSIKLKKVLPNTDKKVALAEIPKVAISSSHDYDAIKNAIALWSLVIGKEVAATTHIPWKNQFAAVNSYLPTAKEYYSYPARLFVQEQVPGGCRENATAFDKDSYNVVTGACMKRDLCRKELGMFDVHIDGFFNNFVAKGVGISTENDGISAQVNSIFDSVMDLTGDDPIPTAVCTNAPIKPKVTTVPTLKCPSRVTDVVLRLNKGFETAPKCSTWYSCSTIDHQGEKPSIVVSVSSLDKSLQDKALKLYTQAEIDRQKAKNSGDFKKGLMVCIPPESEHYTTYLDGGIAKESFEGQTGIKRHVTPKMALPE